MGRGHLLGELSVEVAAPARCGSMDEVTSGSASGSCTGGGRGHRDTERSTRGRVSTDDGNEEVVSTDDGGVARGGTVGVHG
jgi:hypothetical protein